MSIAEANAREKNYEIVVNGQQLVVHDDVLSYEQLVQLAFPGSDPGLRYTITFRGAKEPKEGSLKPGGTVEIKKQGAIFSVTATVKS